MQVLLTFDVELCPGIHRLGMDVEDNLAWFVFGVCPEGTFGLAYELRRLSEHGFKGVFFVDAMAAEVVGGDVLKRIVAPILEAGHEIQLHLHTEWLDLAPVNPVAPRRGANLAHYALEDQCVLIELAREHLVAAGAPPPTTFRAGNFGANDDTLQALAALGIANDSSLNAPYLGSECAISLPPTQIDPVYYRGITEFPVSCIFDRPGNRRHAQLCALSSREMQAGLLHGLGTGQRVFTIVAHSVELVSHERIRSNKTVIGRFESLLALLAERQADLPTVNFADLDAIDLSQPSTAASLPADWARTARRMGEQLVSNVLYEHIGARRLRRETLRPRATAFVAAP